MPFPAFGNRNRNDKIIPNFRERGFPLTPGLATLVHPHWTKWREGYLCSRIYSLAGNSPQSDPLQISSESRCFFSVTILFNFYFLTSPLCIDRAWKIGWLYLDTEICPNCNFAILYKGFGSEYFFPFPESPVVGCQKVSGVCLDQSADHVVGGSAGKEMVKGAFGGLTTRLSKRTATSWCTT